MGETDAGICPGWSWRCVDPDCCHRYETAANIFTRCPECGSSRSVWLSQHGAASLYESLRALASMPPHNWESLGMAERLLEAADELELQNRCLGEDNNRIAEAEAELDRAQAEQEGLKQVIASRDAEILRLNTELLNVELEEPEAEEPARPMPYSALFIGPRRPPVGGGYVCLFCGAQERCNTVGEMRRKCMAHMLVCQHHPMRALEAELDHVSDLHAAAHMASCRCSGKLSGLQQKLDELQEDCAEARRIGCELTLDTQTMGEMATALVALVDKARAERNRAAVRAELLHHELEQAHEEKARRVHRWASRDAVEAPELPHAACGPNCDEVDELVDTANRYLDGLSETEDELEDVQRELERARQWAARWKLCAMHNREGRIRANAAATGLLRQVTQSVIAGKLSE